MRSLDVETSETHRFVREQLWTGHERVLEVGCGAGALARRLQADGHDVVAIDSSAESVKAATELGVAAVQATWPHFDAEPFDAVLFTRSLHHIHPLEPAIERAKSVLKPSGVVIVEDFAFTDVQQETAEWFYQLLLLLDVSGVLLPAEDTFGRKLLNGGGAFALWLDHVHEINSAAAVLQGINRHFRVVSTATAPYLYRYVSQMVDDDVRGARTIAGVLGLERATGATKGGFFLGRRIVARHDGLSKP